MGETAGLEIETDAQRASIKRPITCPESTFDYLTVLSMPQVSFDYNLGYAYRNNGKFALAESISDEPSNSIRNMH